LKQPRTTLRIAVALLFMALGLLVAADVAGSFPLLLGATVAGGAVLALGYRGSLQSVNEMAPPEHRAELVSTYLLVCYSANSLPVLGVGLLARVVEPRVAHSVFAGFLAALGIVALVADGRSRALRLRAGAVLQESEPEQALRGGHDGVFLRPRRPPE
jgi:NO-binding membrane sensor protein with MHYT domain